MFDFKEIFSVTLILFSVIDIVGSIPLIISLRRKYGHVQSEKATLISGIIMIAFLFVGNIILKLFGIDVKSFSVAGGIVMFILGLEMILDKEFFKSDAHHEGKTSSVVPLAFPLIAGTGTMTSLLSLKAEFSNYNIVAGIIINLIFVYTVLKSTNWLERKLGEMGFMILRKFFGIILLSIAIKLIKTNLL